MSEEKGDGRIKRGVVVIVGPTAVGKTLVAIKVAEEVNGEIISADSRQIYRGMEIGSGAPSQELMARVRHHLVGVYSPYLRITAGDYARLAKQVVEKVMGRGKLPIIVGGSGLYLRALIDGLAPMPRDEIIRKAIEREIEARGMEAMREELARIDPPYADKVGPRDRKRLIRALEVYRLTGTPFSVWHQRGSGGGLSDRYPLLMFGLTRERAELRACIAGRVQELWNKGWVREVEGLAQDYGGFDRIPTAVLEAVGYKEVISYLNGVLTEKETLKAITLKTWQLAKRQLTWFKSDRRIKWLSGSGEGAIEEWVNLITCTVREVFLQGKGGGVNVIT